MSVCDQCGKVEKGPVFPYAKMMTFGLDKDRYFCGTPCLVVWLNKKSREEWVAQTMSPL